MVVELKVIGKRPKQTRRVPARVSHSKPQSKNRQHCRIRKGSGQKIDSTLGYFYFQEELYRIDSMSKKTIIATNVSVLPSEKKFYDTGQFNLSEVSIFFDLGYKEKIMFPCFYYGNDEWVMRVIEEYDDRFLVEFVNNDQNPFIVVRENLTRYRWK